MTLVSAMCLKNWQYYTGIWLQIEIYTYNKLKKV